MKKFYITTAIDYVNSTPHLGTAYEKIGADVIARFYRFLGHDVFFQMGNDEHSINVKKAAQKEGLSPKDYCDSMRPKFEDVWSQLNLSYNKFVQTSQPEHHEAVQKLFQKIYDAGYIYEGDYEGLYCESCEAYYMEKDLEDGLCPQHKSKPTWIKEKNYFFKLSDFQDKLLKHIEENPEFIIPEIRRNEIINVIKGGLIDLSVSRSGFDWGIPLPIQKDHVVYVWFDALINYLSLIDFQNEGEAYQKYWPADLHIIGKDITRFHCVIWPAMLMAAGMDVPEHVFAHGFVYLKGEKMSKSLGNVVQPLDVAGEYGADALRYYLLRTSSFGDDGNFTWDDFSSRYNSDLANGLGNLVSRTAGMIQKYFDGALEPSSLSGKDLDLAARFQTHLEKTKEIFDLNKDSDFAFHRCLEFHWSWIADCDRYIDEEAPWTLAKQGETERLASVLTTIARSLFHLSLILSPFIPQTCEKIWSTFGWDKLKDWQEVDSSVAWDESQKIQINSERQALFPRIEKKV